MTDQPGHSHPHRAERLNDVRRLQTQVSDQDLARVLELRGDEDVLDLGSGTGFYTDRIAALTTGTVYAVEFQPEMNAHYYRRGLPANVRIVEGDITRLPAALLPASADVACTIATWHEIEGRLDLPGLMKVLRPGGRLVVIDWRRDPEAPEGGPPLAIRSTKEEVADALAACFAITAAADLGPAMFAVTARRPAD